MPSSKGKDRKRAKNKPTWAKFKDDFANFRKATTTDKAALEKVVKKHGMPFFWLKSMKSRWKEDDQG